MMDAYKINVTREARFSCGAKTYSVEIDGMFVGKLKNGGSVSIHTASGAHTVAFLYGGRVKKAVSVTVEPCRPVASLAVTHDWWGKLVVSDRGASAMGALASPAQKRRHPVRNALAITACVLVVAAAWSGASSDRSQQRSASSPEQTVQSLLDAAADDFAGGRYLTAIAKCDSAKAEHPDAAASIDTCLSELYGTAINITAVDLYNAYDANEVSADSAYKDKVVVVTGTVSDIGKNVINQTYIALQDGSAYGLTGVQCFFGAEQESAVGSVSKGDSVKLIGKCVGENLVNVQLNNCYLLA